MWKKGTRRKKREIEVGIEGEGEGEKEGAFNRVEGSEMISMMNGD